MEWVGILYVVGLFILVSLLTIASFIFQRDKHWMRVWEELGKPDVRSIRELKALCRQNLPDRVPNHTHGRW